MKLLAIRGRNLASLAGAFEIDFTAEPLVSAGLFAITGPTGAGKSTLLDAVCLALYDTFPRLVAASKARFGPAAAGAGDNGGESGAADAIGGDDPRTILRRGAAEGFAEVDFLGRDDRAYRARWEVRRARRRAGGKLQAQELSLADLASGQYLGGTKTETLAAIRSRIGLESDQFRRSVLLAQGEFDAFLRAEPKDRAALLELMTGTGIYSEISRQAFARAKEAQQALAAVEREQGLIEVLSDDDRAALHASIAGHEDEEATLAGERQHRQRERDWYAERQRRTDALAEAEQALAAATGASAAAAEDRARLDRLRQARPLLPLLEDLRRLDGEIEALAGEVERADAEAGEAGRALAEAKAAHVEAGAVLERAETAFREAGPLLSAAADLDTRIDEATRVVTATADDRATADTVLAEQETRERTARERRHLLAEEIAGLEAWLGTNEAVGRLADRLDDCLGQLDQWAAASHRRDDLAARLVTALADLAGLRQRLADGQHRLAAADAEIDRRRQRLTGLEQALAAEDPVALAARAAAADAAKVAVKALVALADTAAALVERSRLLALKAGDARRDRSAAEQALQALDPRRAAAVTTLEEARRALPLATAALDAAAETLRGLLRPGEACPVCGATHHPAAAAGTALTEQARAHVARVTQLEMELAGVDAEIGRQRVVLETAMRALAAAADDALSLAADHQRCRDAWSVAGADLARALPPLGLPPPVLPAEPLADAAPAAAIDALRPLDAAIAGEAARARGAFEQAQARQAEREKARQSLDDAREERDRLAAEQLQRQRDEAAGDKDLTQLQDARAAADREAATLATRLRPLLAVAGDWEVRLAGRVAGGMAEVAGHCRQLAATWTDRVAALCDQKERVNALDREVSATQAAAKAARERQAEARAKAAAAADKLAALRIERAGLFDGRPTGEVRSALNQGRLDAKERAREAADGLRLATGRAEAAAAAAAQFSRRFTDTRAARDAKDSAAAEAAAACGVPVGEAEALLAIEPGWIAAAEARLAALITRVTEAAAVLGERQAALAAHLAEGEPTLPAAAVAARLAELDRLIDAARGALGQCRAAMAIDDGNRRRRLALATDIERQRVAAHRWKAMADLIGSQDGARFRRFAQRLTLDRMLALANRQLQDLTPRYLLQTVPGGELEIQVVDRDMGDDVRSVASLSGGERFLASLALALALAAMGSERTRIETLFIDEGFGALDAESLEIAISALEALQATGRTVGVISHVQAMVERIGVQVQVSRQGGGRSSVRVCRV